MALAPLCRSCGVREWQHLCSGAAPSEVERRVLAARASRKVQRNPPATKPPKGATKPLRDATKPSATKPAGAKGGRPRVGGEAMSSTERARRRRAALRLVEDS